MSPGPNYHGWTHRPKEQGGTDPIPAADAAEIKSIVCTGASETMFSDSESNVVWQTNDNRNPECFTPELFSSPDYYQIRILEDGVYTATCYFTASVAIGFGDADVAISMYRSDRGQHVSRRWHYYATSGFNDVTQQWTFEMDGTGGSNRRIEFLFINFHPPVAGTDDNISADDIRIEVHKWPGAIVL